MFSASETQCRKTNLCSKYFGEGIELESDQVKAPLLHANAWSNPASQGIHVQKEISIEELRENLKFAETETAEAHAQRMTKAESKMIEECNRRLQNSIKRNELALAQTAAHDRNKLIMSALEVASVCAYENMREPDEGIQVSPHFGNSFDPISSTTRKTLSEPILEPSKGGYECAEYQSVYDRPNSEYAYHPSEYAIQDYKSMYER